MNIGQQLSHYIIEDKIGDGGFGDVFRARDINTGIDVGIKCSRPGDSNQLPDQQQRFLREVSCASKISHPNIVQVYEYGALPDGTLYLVMEYVNGMNLENAIKQSSPLSFEYAVKIIVQVLDALGCAHGQSIIHRDLKPANIMIVHEGYEEDTVKLLDFGIAKAFDGTQPDLTRQFFQNSVGFGTPQYMPPEQFFGKNLGPHTDLYAIGLVFYEMLTGNQAFSGKNLSEVIQRQLKEFPGIPKPYCDGPLLDVFRKALAKDVSMRYANAAAMAEDIRNIEKKYQAWYKVYCKTSSNVPVFPETNETKVNLPEYNSEDISSFNTAIFEASEEDGATSTQDAVTIYDEFEEEDNLPTDDMSRLNLPLPPSMARPEVFVSTKRDDRTSTEISSGGNVGGKVPDPADISEACTLMFDRVGADIEMPDYLKTNDAKAVKLPPEPPPVTIARPRNVPTQNYLRPTNNFSAPTNNFSTPTNDYYSPKNEVVKKPDEDELPPVFHQQKTRFLQNHLINTSASRAAYNGKLSAWQKFKRSRFMIALGASLIGRVCRTINYKFNKLIDELYEWHFGALVACICLLIIIMTAVFIIIFLGGKHA